MKTKGQYIVVWRPRPGDPYNSVGLRFTLEGANALADRRSGRVTTMPSWVRYVHRFYYLRDRV